MIRRFGVRLLLLMLTGLFEDPSHMGIVLTQWDRRRWDLPEGCR